jgi:hypothetical protein
MGVSEDVVATLVSSARERHEESSPPAQAPAEPAIAARRLRDNNLSGGGRWADADAHYESLASGPRFKARRATPPRS